MSNFSSPEDVIADEKFLAWYFSKDEQAVTNWEHWLSSNPDQKPVVEEAVQLMGNLSIQEAGVPLQHTQKAYEDLQHRIDEKVIPITRYKRRWWIGAAAAVLIIALGLAFFMNQPAPQSSVVAQYGQTRTQQLPDGSVIMLNANSTVKYGKEWTPDCDREVWLKGEAFFQVAKTQQKNRFIVHTGELDVIVTGTRFNVWTRDNKTSVLLTEGSVTIRTPDGKETKMIPGDFVEISNNTLEKRKGNEESVLAWKESKLLFDRTPVPEVCRIIYEHYGVKVTITDSSLNEQTINGMMQNDNLDLLLQSLEATNNFRITRKDKEIFISKP